MPPPCTVSQLQGFGTGSIKQPLRGIPAGETSEKKAWQTCIQNGTGFLVFYRKEGGTTRRCEPGAATDQEQPLLPKPAGLPGVVTKKPCRAACQTHVLRLQRGGRPAQRGRAGLPAGRSAPYINLRSAPPAPSSPSINTPSAGSRPHAAPRPRSAPRLAWAPRGPGRTADPGLGPRPPSRRRRSGRRGTA